MHTTSHQPMRLIRTNDRRRNRPARPTRNRRALIEWGIR